MVHRLELLIEPHVQIDDGDPLKLIKLTEVGNILPAFWQHAFEYVDGHGGDILIGNNFLARSEQKVVDGSVLLVDDNFLNGRAQLDPATPGLNVVHGRLTPAVRLVAIEEGHLQPVALVQKAIHGGEHDGHTELVGVDEVEGLGHGDEDLLVDALGHAVLPHELRDAELVLGVDEGLPLDEHGQQGRGRLQLLGEREHLLVHEDGEAEVEGGGDAGNEVEGGELPGQLLHGEDHLVDLPLQAVVDAQLGEHVHHVWVGAEEDVEPSLDPVAVRILPRRHFPAQHVPRLVHCGLVSSVN